MVGVAATIMIALVLGGAALIYDGGRALTAKREIINVAEGAARAGVAATGRDGLDPGAARQAAADHVAAAGVPDSDVVNISVSGDTVTVTLQAHRTGVFTVLGGRRTFTVTGTGTATADYGGASP